MEELSNMISASNVTLRLGKKALFEDVNIKFTEGNCYGLIGANGAGKSTFLKILSGALEPTNGDVIITPGQRLSVLEQDHFKYDDFTVLDTVIMGNARLYEIMKEKDAIYAKEDFSDEDGIRASELEGEFAEMDGWEAESNAASLLNGLGVDTEFHYSLMKDLNGSQKVKVLLAKALFGNPDILLLDEPTNHLDLDMTEWLEEYLRRTNLSLLMVTHDRYFLDRVCSEIIEIDNQQLYQYKGNYSYYLEKREERIEAKSVEIERANNLYRTELDWMRRMPQARGHKARYREDAFYELEKVAKQRQRNDNVKLEVKASYIGSKIFEADHLSKSFGDLKILDDFSYIFSRYEKMGIVGNNGTGKSTFIKILMGLVKPDGGTIDIGETVRFGYYSQDGLQFDEQMKVIDVVQDIAEVIELGNGKKLTASQFLQHFLFTPETQHSYVCKLSGGERRRLYLCTVLMRNPNFLVLDEPTNDLDIITLNVLEEYLQSFKGCVIVVSHDRYFMDKVVDHLLVFNGQGDIRDFPGNYSDYRDWKEAKAQKEKEAEKPQEEKTARVRLNDKRKMSFKEKREFEQLEKEIAQLEAEKVQIEELLCSGTLSVDELTDKSKRLPEVNELIDEKTMRWLELSEIEG